MILKSWVAGWVLLALVAAVPASADLMMKRASHRDAFSMMGQSQPAEDDTVTVWLGPDRVAMAGGQMDVIVRLDRSKVYLMDHASKTYNELALPIDLAKLLDPKDPNTAQVQQMMEMMKSTATVTATEERKKVGDWNARLYHAVVQGSMMTFRADIWATTDVKVDLSVYRSLEEATFGLNPALKDAAAEFRKIDGLPVLEEQTVTVMGNEMKMSERLLQMKETAPPAGTYDPPAGYAAKPFNLMDAMQRR